MKSDKCGLVGPMASRWQCVSRFNSHFVGCYFCRIPFSSADDAQIKRCPMCHVPIEKNDGCAQMMCKRCKHVFCWYCLASLDVSTLHQQYSKLF